MLKTTQDATRDVPFPVEDPEFIPVQRYYDPDFYQAELDHVWPHAWQMACRLEQIPNVGDWVEYHNVGQSVIVVRAEDGVRAFYNACRHRGVPLTGTDEFASGNCGRSGFACPFHGWRYDMNGKNIFVYGAGLFSENVLDPAELNLRPCRVEEALGCAWINHDDAMPSVRECLGPVVDRLEMHGAHKMRSEWWYATVLPANWKVAMEAFMEGYHVMKTHPQLQQSAPALYNSLYAGARSMPSIREFIDQNVRHFELLSEGMAGMCHAKEVEIIRDCANVDLPEDFGEAVGAWFTIVRDAISTRLRAQGEDVPDLVSACESHPINALEFLFPHYFLLPNFTSMASYRIRPLGPESCLFELWSLTHFPAGQEPEVPMKPVMLPYDSDAFPPIPRQDYSNIPIQQIGLRTNGIDHMRLSREKEGLISNFQRLLDGYIAGVPSAKLAAANALFGGNFDGEIKDLGF